MKQTKQTEQKQKKHDIKTNIRAGAGLLGQMDNTNSIHADQSKIGSATPMISISVS